MEGSRFGSSGRIMHRIVAAIGALAVVLGAVVLVPPAVAQGAAMSADAQFKAIYTEEWAWREAQFTGEVASRADAVAFARSRIA